MKKTLLLLALIVVPVFGFAKGKKQAETNPLGTGEQDRAYWASLAYKMAAPVLENMANGTLQKNMKLELSPTWDNRDKKVAYMECFGRLMAGIAPWLNLPDDDTEEGKMRKQLREWALKAYKNAVDPESPDYLGWQSGGQTLVDAAYVVESLFRGYSALWEPLDDVTKQRYIKELQGLRRYDPPYTNWLLFVGMEEAFIMYVGGQYDAFRIKMALSKAEEWYIGDGLYSDGPSFAFDYYNAYVIQPMYTECLQMVSARQGNNSYLVRSKGDNRNGATNRLKEVVKRMQKYSVILERFISFPRCRSLHSLPPRRAPAAGPARVDEATAPGTPQWTSARRHHRRHEAHVRGQGREQFHPRRLPHHRFRGQSSQCCRLVHQQRFALHDFAGLHAPRFARRRSFLDRRPREVDIEESLGRRRLPQRPQVGHQPPNPLLGVNSKFLLHNA